jgi:sec-independent protein translocase protein TatC
MTTALRPIDHQERLSLVEHLDELRSRLIICVAAFLVAFGVCLWQDNAVLTVIDRPLEQTQVRENSKDPLEQGAVYQRRIAAAAKQTGDLLRSAAPKIQDPALSARATATAKVWDDVAKAAPRASPRRPVTLGVGEPFTQTIKVVAWAAVLLVAPILLYQGYAFVLPAFSPRERKVALPLMLAVPFLFMGGVAFAYYMILPNAINFLQNFNDDKYDILLQAKDFYGFSLMFMGVMGLLFQLPLGIIAITQVGIVSAKQLRRTWRYAFLVIAVLAMILPGTDPVTMLSLMVPMIALYGSSILLASLLERRRSAKAGHSRWADDELIHDDEDD